MTVTGKTILSCGHEDEHGCWGIAVEFDEDQCVAGEGFVPTTVYAHYCHDCAIEVTRQAAYAAEERGARMAGLLGPGLDHIAHFINSLDSEGMTPNEVRSAIYAECISPTLPKLRKAE